MHIIAVGLNYRTAPVEIRERFSIEQEHLPDAVRALKDWNSVLECVIVVTCNRTEFYVVVDRENWCHKHVHDFIASWFGVQKADFVPYLYVREDDEALRHLFRVACGLDSMVLGETQILGQVREAFFLAQRERTTGTIFNMLFKQTITVAKKAHAETAIGEHAVSVSYAAIELGKRIFGSFQRKNVLLVGAGKMSELTAKHLEASGAGKIRVVNRTLNRAAELAGKFAGTAHIIEELPALLVDTDVVISSTGSAQVILTKKEVEAAMQGRSSRSLFMIDIAVPRDLDPAIHDVPNVYLYDIDDLEGIVEANIELRRKEAVKIEAMIQEEMNLFRQWYTTLGVGPVIRALQEKASHIHEETMASMRNKLPGLSEHELKIISKLSKSMLNQMMHDPIQRVKEMSPERRGGEALDYFMKLFDLEEAVARQPAEARKPSPENAGAAETAAVKRSTFSLV